MSGEQRTVQHSLDRIQALLEMGRVDQARRESTDAVSATPDEDRLWAALAVIENKRSDYPAAATAAERALALNPANLKAMLVLGPALFHTGKIREAKAMMDRMVDAAPQWAPGLVQRALVYAWHIGTYIKWGTRGPSVPESELKIVREDGAAALALEPQNATHYGQVAEARYLIHDVGVAVDLIDKGLRIAPTSEFLLLQKARFGQLDSRGSVEMARSILAVNPLNSDALRLLHSITWRSLGAVAAWPSIVGALAATFVYSTYFASGENFSRGILAALLVPALILWVLFFSRLRSAASALNMTKFFRENPVGLTGFALTMAANVGLIIGLAWLYILPLKDPLALAQALSLLSVSVVACAAGDIVMRVAASLDERRSGIYSDTAEGRFVAKQALKQQFDGTVVRVVIAIVVLFGFIPGGARPGVEALGAMAAALIATVLVKKGTAAIMRHRRIVPVIWFAFAGVLFAAALYYATLQVQIALG